MTPGSVPWLMRHELRLVWRAGEEKNRLPRLALFALVLAGMSCMGLPFGYLLRGQSPEPDGLAMLVCGLAFCFIAVMSFSSSLAFIAASFIDRGDLDLLLSSPLPMRRLLTVRLGATALRSVAIWLFLFGPAVLVITVLAGPRWLGGLLLLLDAGLAGTSLASWLAIGLFRLIGVRRVKTVTTLVSALSGISMGLVAPFLGKGFGAQHFTGGAAPKIPAEAVLGLPARTLYGEPLAGLILTGSLLSVFLLTTWRLAPTFARISTRSETISRPSAGSAPLRGFGGGLFRLLLVKEYRLLLRNHALLLQILSRAVAFVPLLVINLSQGRATPVAAVALAATLVLGQTSGALVWAFSSTETQPDLLGSAPLPPKLFFRTRLTAALLPSLILVMVAAVITAFFSPSTGLAILVMATGASLSSAAVNATAKASPVRRSAWGGAPRPSTAAIFTDMICCGFWCGAAWLLANASIWTALPAWLGLSTVWLWREVTRRDV